MDQFLGSDERSGMEKVDEMTFRLEKSGTAPGRTAIATEVQ